MRVIADLDRENLPGPQIPERAIFVASAQRLDFPEAAENLALACRKSPGHSAAGAASPPMPPATDLRFSSLAAARFRGYFPGSFSHYESGHSS